LADRFTVTWSLLGPESDRGAAIVGAALIDVALDNALKKYLIPPSDQGDDFLDGRDFTFAMKIDLAHRTGLIRPHVRKALHQIRRIRNAFAHEPHHQTFEDAAVRDRVVNVCELTHDLLKTVIETLRARGLDEVVGVIVDDTPRALVQSLGPRVAFDFVVALHCAGFDYIYDEVTPIQPLT
jgi:hypothetical protein